MTMLPPLSILFFLLFFSQTTGSFGNREKVSFMESIKQLKGCCEKGSKVQGLHQLKLYLTRFGYLNYQNTSNRANAEDDQFDDKLEAALKSYQKYYHLNASGTLDGPTISQMGMPGLPNKRTHIHGSESLHIVSHYNFFSKSPRWPPINSPRWPAGKSNLTYAFHSNYLNRHIPPVNRAFNEWSTRTNYFKFSRIDDFKRADLKISMEIRKHGDIDFEPPGRVAHSISHSFVPPDGRLHFNIEQFWSDVQQPDSLKLDLQTVALQEIGHLLGLEYSLTNLKSIMYWQIYYGEIKGLTEDDIFCFKELYNLK